MTTTQTSTLPWPISLAILATGCALVGWLCATGGQSKDGAGPSIFALMFLIGTMPFFIRRLGGYTLPSLLIVVGAGAFVSLGAFLFKANIVVIPCLLMGGLLSTLFTKNEYGTSKEQQIDLEKQQPKASKFLASPTEQEQNMLWLGDFALVIIISLVLTWLYSIAKSFFNL